MRACLWKLACLLYMQTTVGISLIYCSSSIDVILRWEKRIQSLIPSGLCLFVYDGGSRKTRSNRINMHQDILLQRDFFLLISGLKRKTSGANVRRQVGVLWRSNIAFTACHLVSYALPITLCLLLSYNKSIKFRLSGKGDAFSLQEKYEKTS